MQPLIDLFSKPPASFTWATKEGRAIGTSEGFVLDIWSDRVEAAALFPPDRADLVRRNSTLLQLLLMALRPEWSNSSTWLTQTMQFASRYKPTKEHPIFDLSHTAERIQFTWDRTTSRVTVKVLL